MGKQLITLAVGAVIALLLGFFGLDKLGKLAGAPESQPTTDSATPLSPNPWPSGGTSHPAATQSAGNQNSILRQGGSQQGQVQQQGQGVAAKSQVVIGSFNIQVFGTRKIANQKVMNVLVQVARYFDVLAIQEIRAKDQSVIPRFIQMINSNGAKYDYRIGKRQGRTSSKEQYVFIWNTQSIELIQESWYVPDPRDLIHREPMVATFRCRSSQPQSAFSFSLVNLHTDPDEAKQELNAMASAFRHVQAVQARQRYPEDDIIVLGDFNLPPTKYGQFGALGQMVAAIPATVATNTAGNHSYDNLVFQQTATQEFTGQAGVFKLTGAPFHLSHRDAVAVSDHFPVWALFQTVEAPTSSRGAVANGGTPANR